MMNSQAAGYRVSEISPTCSGDNIKVMNTLINVKRQYSEITFTSGTLLSVLCCVYSVTHTLKPSDLEYALMFDKERARERETKRITATIKKDPMATIQLACFWK